MSKIITGKVRYHVTLCKHSKWSDDLVVSHIFFKPRTSSCGNNGMLWTVAHHMHNQYCVLRKNQEFFRKFLPANQLKKVVRRFPYEYTFQVTAKYCCDFSKGDVPEILFSNIKVLKSGGMTGRKYKKVYHEMVKRLFG